MIQKSTCVRGVLFSCLIFGAVTSWSQIPIEGVVNRTSGGARSIRVPTSSGYSYLVLLDGQKIPTDVVNVVSAADYHELLVFRTNAATSQVETQLVQFNVRAADRGDTETGLPAFVPTPLIPSSAAELSGAHLEVLAPETMPTGLPIPVVAWVRDDDGNAVRGNGTLAATGHPGIPIKRGVGSGLLASTHPAGPLTYSAQLGSLQVNRIIDIEGGTVWTNLTGTLSGNPVWGPDARITLTGSITIPAASTLTIMDGAVVRLNSQVDIVNAGRIVISGTSTRPVVFTPANAAQPWGGFYVTNTTSQLDAVGTIFVSPGARQSGFPGHRDEQPFVFVDNRARVALTNCGIIFGVGQLHCSRDRGAPYASVTLVDTLVQRGTTAGEFNGSSLKFIRSALIELPYEDQFYCADPDCDHDGFYLNTGIHEIRDSLIGWLKDDGIDSGSGGSGATIVTVSNCWFEATYHEACAWSNDRRTITNQHLVTINSGQGIEAGWSGGSGISPYVFANDCLSLANAVGVRFGDNYDWDYWGYLVLTNSLVLNNYRDVWGREWDKWSYGINSRDGTNAMNIQGNVLSVANPNHPNNAVWNGSQNGWRLAPFMSTPPNARVGIGFATWPNQTNMSFIFQGIPVGLSSFTTNEVSVDYVFENGNNTLASGTLTFAAGETVKRIYPSGFDATAYNTIQVRLSNPVRGELTGLNPVVFQGTVPAPQLSLRVVGSQRDMVRVAEGVPVALSASSAQAVTLDYEYANADGTIVTGTLTIPPTQTLGWVEGIEPNYDLVRFSIRNPVAAQITGPTNIYFVRTASNPAPPPTTLIPRGATWVYLDTGIDQGTAWRALNFPATGWESGPAQLGFGESDQATTISDNNQLTTYFRHKFVVSDPADYQNLSMWLLRDDAGVVHLNGNEVYRTSGLPPAPTAISYTTLASTTFENQEDTATIAASRLVAGTNIAAVEIHQESAGSSDVSFNFELNGNPVPPPPPPQRLYTANFEEGRTTLAWGDPAFILETAAEADGTWTQVGSGSPFVIIPSDQQRFYRLRK